MSDDCVIEGYRAALEKYAEAAVAYYNLGCVYWDMNNWSAAVDAWENCLRLNPDHQAACEWPPLACKQLRRHK